jgi:hypothetical protein
MFDPAQGTFKVGGHCLLGSKISHQSEAKMRFLLFALLGVATRRGTSALAQNYPWCAQYSGRALGGS